MCYCIYKINPQFMKGENMLTKVDKGKLNKIFNNFPLNLKKEIKIMKTKTKDIPWIAKIDNRIKQVYSDIQSFNSESAAEFFKYNLYEGQRNIKTKSLQRHINNIKNGLWFPSQVIVAVWKKNGQSKRAILDGQHRIKAIISLDTKDEYQLNVTYLHMDTKDISQFYQMFDNKGNLRNLGDLIKSNICHAKNRDKWNSWKKPIELIQMFGYGCGLFFTKQGISDDLLHKDEIMSNWVFLEGYEEAFDYINELKYTKMPKSTARKFGTVALGAIFNTYINNPEKAKEFWSLVAQYNVEGNNIESKVIKGLFKKIDVIKIDPKAKGENLAGRMFYVIFKSFENYCTGRSQFNRELLKNGKKSEVLDKCFSNGSTLLTVK